MQAAPSDYGLRQAEDNSRGKKMLKVASRVDLKSTSTELDIVWMGLGKQSSEFSVRRTKTLLKKASRDRQMVT